MKTAAAKKIQAKRARRPAYLLVRKLFDQTTGEEIGALVPAHDVDARLLRERIFQMGREVRAELKQPRNSAFHRLVHAIGNLLVDSVEEFRDSDAHAAVKVIQAKTGVCCEPVEIDLGSLGRVTAQVSRSSAFDEMAEDEFRQLFEAIVAHIGEHYARVISGSVRADFWKMIHGETNA